MFSKPQTLHVGFFCSVSETIWSATCICTKDRWFEYRVLALTWVCSTRYSWRWSGGDSGLTSLCSFSGRCQGCSCRRCWATDSCFNLYISASIKFLLITAADTAVSIRITAPAITYNISNTEITPYFSLLSWPVSGVCRCPAGALQVFWSVSGAYWIFDSAFPGARHLGAFRLHPCAP